MIIPVRNIYICPQEEVNRWARGEYRKQLTAMETEQVDSWNKGYEQEINHYASSSFNKEELVNWKYQRYMQDYLRCILSVDENVGRILNYLDQHGLADNTVVVYTSDQGFFLGEHGLFDKRYMYEESLRAPLLIRYPDRIEPGGICHELVQNLDIAPTILELAGAEIPDDMQGQSLGPLFESPVNGDWRDAVYYQFYESGWGVPQHYGVRTKSHKLIHFLSEPDNWELYDLDNDPGELVNLYDNPGNEILVQELKSRLGELREYYQVKD
jgi:arylsulfatase A-like enzyme